jgi:hypothetical protein
MTVTFSQLGKMGRLGNCLFQIATTISTAIKNNTDYQFPPWQYEPNFNLHNCFSSNIAVSKTYQEKAFHYDEIPASNSVDLIGYFQSWKYFENNKEEIAKALTPIYKFEREEGLCSLHIRRGDYLNFQNCHPLMSMDYYSKAMEMSGCKKFLILSDDMDWAKRNFVGNQYEYSEGNGPAIDLALMAKTCESNIICNSSFSWWGAWLNKNENKKVLAPSTWFGPALQHNTKDLLPPEWIKI